MDRTQVEILVVKGGYRVKVKGQVHWVNKQRQCSCTRTSCAAIRLVTDYLRCGGQRAPDAKSPQSPNTFPCPICGAPATGSLENKNWACSADRRHFWAWRTVQLRAARAEAMKDATPYTQSAHGLRIRPGAGRVPVGACAVIRRRRMKQHAKREGTGYACPLRKRSTR